MHGHFPPFELARRVADLGQRYEHALVAVERNNHGFGVLAYLNTLGYENIFEKDGQLGWLTSAASRPAMIDNMAAVLMAEPELFHSLRLLEECRTFVRHLSLIHICVSIILRRRGRGFMRSPTACMW